MTRKMITTTLRFYKNDGAVFNSSILISTFVISRTKKGWMNKQKITDLGSNFSTYLVIYCVIFIRFVRLTVQATSNMTTHLTTLFTIAYYFNSSYYLCHWAQARWRDTWIWNGFNRDVVIHLPLMDSRSLRQLRINIACLLLTWNLEPLWGMYAEIYIEGSRYYIQEKTFQIC